MILSRFFNFLMIALGLLVASQNAGAGSIAITSGPAGAIPTTAGTGLNGSFYSFSTYPWTLTNALTMISQAAQATATFTTTAVCFPDCAGTSLADSNSPTTLYANASNFTFAPGATAPNVGSSATVISGYIAIATPGSYTFYLGSDDGSSLTINGQTIINANTPQAYTQSSNTVTFASAGLYAINVSYFEDGGYTALDLYATNSSGQCIIGRAANCVASSGTPTTLFYGSVAAVPEPATLSLLGAGLAGLGIMRRRARRMIPQ